MKLPHLMLGFAAFFGTLPVFAQVPAASKVVVVVEENHSYSTITSATMPWLTSVAAQNGLLTWYFALIHPSIGNYFDMTAGQTITNNDGYTGTVTADNIVRHFLTDGITWKAYAECLPSVGYIGSNTGCYTEHHNPFSYFSDVRNSSVQSNNLVPFSQFATDLANGTLPRFSFVVPNAADDAHDGSLQAADTWLQNNIAPLLASPDFQPGGSGVLIVVFDEAAYTDTQFGGGQVYAAVIGPKVKPGGTSNLYYNHYSLLKTVMTALGETSFPAKAATARAIGDIWISGNTTAPAAATH
jgi:phosphatidylinositol-3-phosphatase